MISIIKSIIWIAGALVITYFVLNYFGYEINRDYFSSSKKQCEEKLKVCSDDIFHKGIDNSNCDLKCVDPKLIIKKK